MNIIKNLLKWADSCGDKELEEHILLICIVIYRYECKIKNTIVNEVINVSKTKEK